MKQKTVGSGVCHLGIKKSIDKNIILKYNLFIRVIFGLKTVKEV